MIQLSSIQLYFLQVLFKHKSPWVMYKHNNSNARSSHIHILLQKMWKGWGKGSGSYASVFRPDINAYIIMTTIFLWPI